MQRVVNRYRIAQKLTFTAVALTQILFGSIILNVYTGQEMSSSASSTGTYTDPVSGPQVDETGKGGRHVPLANYIALFGMPSFAIIGVVIMWLYGRVGWRLVNPELDYGGFWYYEVWYNDSEFVSGASTISESMLPEHGIVQIRQDPFSIRFCGGKGFHPGDSRDWIDKWWSTSCNVHDDSTDVCLSYLAKKEPRAQPSQSHLRSPDLLSYAGTMELAARDYAPPKDRATWAKWIPLSGMFNGIRANYPRELHGHTEHVAQRGRQQLTGWITLRRISSRSLWSVGKHPSFPSEATKKLWSPKFEQQVQQQDFKFEQQVQQQDFSGLLSQLPLESREKIKSLVGCRIGTMKLVMLDDGVFFWATINAIQTDGAESGEEKVSGTNNSQ